MSKPRCSLAVTAVITILTLGVPALAWQPTGSARGDASAGTATLEGPAGIRWSADELGDRARVQVTFTATHQSGEGPLFLGSGPEDAWRAVEMPADGKARAVELWALRPLEAPLYLGCAKGDRWSLSDLRLGQWSGPKLEHLWPAPQTFAPLPGEWKPKGLLDARVVTVGREQRLAVDVGSLRMILPASVECVRGQRDEFKAEAVNTATGEIQLTIGLQGPPWIWLPATTVPIAAGRNIVLRPQAVSLWSGESWCKLVFESGGQQRVAPLCVNCSPAYPAFGAFLTEQASEADLQAVLAAPVSLVMAPAKLVAGLGPKRLGPEVIAYGNAAELERLAACDAAGWVRLACVWDEAPEWARQVQALAASATVSKAGWMLSAGPMDVQPGPEGLQGASEAQLASAAACGKGLSCLVARPPTLPVVEVVRSSVAGLGTDRLPFWTDFHRRFDPAPLRAQLAARGLTVPVAWVDAQTAGNMAPADQSTAWAAASAALLYQGATAMCGRWPVPQDNWAWTEMVRELTAAVPLMGVPESDIGSTSTDAPVIYRVFLRGREGTLTLSNTTATKVNIAIELAAEPLAASIVRFAPGSQPVREYVMPFRFSQAAFEQGRPLVFLNLAPAETTLLNIRLVDAHPRWLRAIERRKPPAPTGPQKRWSERGGWWEDLQRRARNLRQEKERDEHR
ncbi:MAG: hypothetical protein AB7W28_08040 [Armatimonadota bacterium]